MNKSILLSTLYIVLVISSSIQLYATADSCPSEALRNKYYAKLKLDGGDVETTRLRIIHYTKPTSEQAIGVIKAHVVAYDSVAMIKESATSNKRFALNETCGEISFQYPVYRRLEFTDDNFKIVKKPELYSIEYSCQGNLDFNGVLTATCSNPPEFKVPAFVCDFQGFVFDGTPFPQEGCGAHEFQVTLMDSGQFIARPM